MHITNDQVHTYDTRTKHKLEHHNSKQTVSGCNFYRINSKWW